MDLVQILKALADETRIRILNLLAYQELCGCEIEIILGINQSNTSRHLNKLKSAKLIISKKQAQWVYFQLNPAILTEHPFVVNLIDTELKNVEECQVDLLELARFKERGLGCEQLRGKGYTNSP